MREGKLTGLSPCAYVACRQGACLPDAVVTEFLIIPNLFRVF